MNSTERYLRILLAFQGVLYLAFNIWALIATSNYLGFIHPNGSLLETRELAAVTTVSAIFFIAGAWRKDLLKPAAFLGLGTALALTVVQLFHLPAVGFTWLIGDFILELVMSGLYVGFVFFRRDLDGAVTKKEEKGDAGATDAPVLTPDERSAADQDAISADASDAGSADAGASDGGSSSAD